MKSLITWTLCLRDKQLITAVQVSLAAVQLTEKSLSNKTNTFKTLWQVLFEVTCQRVTKLISIRTRSWTCLNRRLLQLKRGRWKDQMIQWTRGRLTATRRIAITKNLTWQSRTRILWKSLSVCICLDQPNLNSLNTINQHGMTNSAKDPSTEVKKLHYQTHIVICSNRRKAIQLLKPHRSITTPKLKKNTSNQPMMITIGTNNRLNSTKTRLTRSRMSEKSCRLQVCIAKDICRTYPLGL